VLQCVAVLKWCCLKQVAYIPDRRVAVCCSVLQCVAVFLDLCVCARM